MAGRVDQVEDVVLAVVGLVVEAHGLRLDGDAALALDVHVVEHLLLHVARLEPAGRLDQAVGQRRLAVVDMGDDGEIADVGNGGAHGAPRLPAAFRLATSGAGMRRTCSVGAQGLRPCAPPLSCRTSPPQVGRSAAARAAAYVRRCWTVARSRAGCRSPSLWGRCPAGQRGVTLFDGQDGAFAPPHRRYAPTLPDKGEAMRASRPEAADSRCRAPAR